jgi:hypothetical protein
VLRKYVEKQFWLKDRTSSACAELGRREGRCRQRRHLPGNREYAPEKGTRIHDEVLIDFLPTKKTP